ncbi:MAG TPA: VOC family protein [Gammaproteobacteria bacterium]|nr:VOC family protein [Gammaproteobacteria bacterium]
MLDHIGFPVSDFKRSKEFYEKALAPVEISLIMEIGPEITGKDSHAGFGSDGRAYFWIGDGKSPGGQLHMAFTAPDRSAVDNFYRAALAAGGKDNGAPGLRPHYHPDYYGAFVLDPDGNNIEAVCRAPA